MKQQLQKMDPAQIRQNNRKVYDSMAAAKSPLCRPATDEELASPLRTVDGSGWLGSSITGKHVLCLAAGGGHQSSLMLLREPLSQLLTSVVRCLNSIDKWLRKGVSISA